MIEKKNIYSIFKESKKIAVLIDPDKIQIEDCDLILDKVHQSIVNLIFIGGSYVEPNHFQTIISYIKSKTHLGVVIFPGHYSQVSNHADAILYLNLISGRNPDYLIEHQIRAVHLLRKTNLEIIPTAYILIDGGSETAVQRISQTKPISQHNIDFIVDTAIAGEMMGNKLIYLEAGSGAKKSVSEEIIKKVSENLSIPIIVGGGIKEKNIIFKLFDAGADVVIIGNAFEKNISFFE